MNGKSFAEISAEASLLVSEISRREVGDTITYEQIERIIGWDVRLKRGIMSTVIKRLLADYGLVLSNVRGEGYVLLSDTEKLGDSENARQRIRRQARRNKKRLSTVDLSKLDEPQRIQCLTEVASSHVVETASQNRTVKKLESDIDGKAEPIAIGTALEAMKKNLSR